MGNQASVDPTWTTSLSRRTPPKSTKRSFTFRLPPPSDPNCSPDVDTLGLPFPVYTRIFVRLPLADLHRCLLVCKEWRSLLDTCDFWRAYLRHNYDFRTRSPRENSFLHIWQTANTCLRKNFAQDSVPADESFVFRPFPEVWRCGAAVPFSLRPPDGSVITYHDFFRALRWVTRLRVKVKEFGLSNQLEVCLFQWIQKRMPTARDVLAVFQAHSEIIKSCEDAHLMTQHELKNFYAAFIAKINERGAIFDDEFFRWFTGSCGERSVVFTCSRHAVVPTPAFIVTTLAPGWIGGLLYAV